MRQRLLSQSAGAPKVEIKIPDGAGIVPPKSDSSAHVDVRATVEPAPAAPRDGHGPAKHLRRLAHQRESEFRRLAIL
jgi:hypothetical protein